MIINRIPHIYHDTVYAKKIFEIIEDKHLRIREMFKELSLFNDLKKCKGALLDVKGNNFKIHRLNRTDDEYRKIIAFEVSSLQFIGNIEEIRSILSTYFYESIENFLIYEFSGKIRITIPDTINKNEVEKLIKKIKTAGVGLLVDFDIYIEDYLMSELEEMTLTNIALIKLARR